MNTNKIKAPPATVSFIRVGAQSPAVRQRKRSLPQALQLTQEETESLRSQIVISNASRGGRRYLPYAFTEHGALMLSSVLKSKRAIQMSIRVVRVFIGLREMLATHKGLATRMEKLEAGQKGHASILSVIVEEIRKLKQRPEPPPKQRIGFHIPDKND